MAGAALVDEKRASWMVVLLPPGVCTFSQPVVAEVKTITASGTFQQYANGQSLMGTYRAPVVASSPGNMQITFTAADRANLTFPNGQVVPIRRFTF